MADIKIYLWRIHSKISNFTFSSLRLSFPLSGLPSSSDWGRLLLRFTADIGDPNGGKGPELELEDIFSPSLSTSSKKYAHACGVLWSLLLFTNRVYGFQLHKTGNADSIYTAYIDGTRLHLHWLTLLLLGQLWSQVRAWIYDDLDQSHMIPLQSILTVNVKQTSSESTQNFGWHVT